MLKVTLFSRKITTGWSVERTFSDVYHHLPKDIDASFCHNKFTSQGFFKRSFDVFRSACHQGQVNHVTGDVHYLTFALRRRITILTVLDCIFMKETNLIKRLFLWFFWVWLPIRRCGLITTISEATRQELLQWVECDPARVRVIHCAVSTSFQPSPKIFNYVCPRVLHIGTSPNKNLERHISALQGLPCELVVIGNPSENQLRCLDQSGLTYFVLSGLSEEAMVEQYRLCDAVLFASTYEGFGLPIVEAQAVGRPVITGNLSSMPEVAGGAACVIDPLNVISIRSGLQKVFYDTTYREELVERGYENVKRFNVELIANQYANLYREVAKFACNE